MKRYWLASLLLVVAIAGSALLVSKQIIAAPAMPHSAGCCRYVHFLTPRRMVARYFAGLNARHFYAAWKLEAPCRVAFPRSSGPFALAGSAGYPGREARYPAPTAQTQHPVLESTHVTKITPLHIPILTRHHILAFGVRGWYAFDYSRVPSANMKHKNGFHVVKIAVWRCHGRWGVEPEGPWLDGSGVTSRYWWGGGPSSETSKAWSAPNGTGGGRFTAGGHTYSYRCKGGQLVQFHQSG